MDGSSDPVDLRVWKLAIFAVGGQGGGVLSNWIIDLAQSQGWQAQLTSVPGVAQRTGATIYYIEIAPPSEHRPVFALIPTPGNLDVILASELMEAGRAIQRGLVSAKTTVVTSTHRDLAVSEKSAPGNGILPGQGVLDAARSLAMHVVTADMEQLAITHGSAVSSSLFGGLCAAEVLPFPRSAYEATIRASGRGVQASLAAFNACFEEIRGPSEVPAPAAATDPSPPVAQPQGPQHLVAAYQDLANRCQSYPRAASEIVQAGLHKTVDYQDVAYGEEYLNRLDEFHALDRDNGSANKDWALTCEAARHIANAMTYDDVIRVADLKTRGARFERVRADAGADDSQVLQITEYFHPRLEEVLATLPTGLARFIEASNLLSGLIGRCVNRGRRIRSDTTFGFLSLYLVSALRPFRRRLLRHQSEGQHMQAWLGEVRSRVAKDYDFAVEILRCRKLIKGYSDTHKRGTSKFERVMSSVPRLDCHSDAAPLLRRLTAAAREDENGKSLDELLATILDGN